MNLLELLPVGGECVVQSWQGLAFAVFACVEFWLGKTDKVKAGSTLEAIINGVKKLLSLFGKK